MWAIGKILHIHCMQFRREGDGCRVIMGGGGGGGEDAWLLTKLT